MVGWEPHTDEYDLSRDGFPGLGLLLIGLSPLHAASFHGGHQRPRLGRAVSIPRSGHPDDQSPRNYAMQYEYVAIPDTDVPQGVEPAFQHALATYASEVNKTASVWRAVPDELLDFQPPGKVNTIRTILAHQLLSERRFFAEFAGLDEPPVEELLPLGEKPLVQ